MPKILYMVKDIHNENAGRNLAKTMLESGYIDVFFVEYGLEISMHRINEGLPDLVEGDATPTISDLARIALTKSADVVSCDLRKDDIIRIMEERHKSTGEPQRPASPQMIGIRDIHAAKKVVAYMNAAPDNYLGLLMYGADHFKIDQDKFAAPLHLQIRDALSAGCTIRPVARSPFIGSAPAPGLPGLIARTVTTTESASSSIAQSSPTLTTSSVAPSRLINPLSSTPPTSLSGHQRVEGVRPIASHSATMGQPKSQSSSSVSTETPLDIEENGSLIKYRFLRAVHGLGGGQSTK